MYEWPGLWNCMCGQNGPLRSLYMYMKELGMASPRHAVSLVTAVFLQCMTDTLTPINIKHPPWKLHHPELPTVCVAHASVAGLQKSHCSETKTPHLAGFLVNKKTSQKLRC